MTGSKFLTPTKVGILVVGSAAAFAGFLQVVSTRGVDTAGSYDIYAVFDDVLGLEEKSPVQIAGIDIGRIGTVSLFKNKAKLRLRINGGIVLYEDAKIEKVAISLLGDYKLAVDPGGAPGMRQLKDGDEIKNVVSLSSTDAIIAEVRQMSESISKLISGTPEDPAPLERIVADVERSSAAARKILEEVAGNINQSTGKLDQILDNVNRFTKDLSTISEGKDRDLDSIVTDARQIAKSLRATSENLEQMIVGQDKEDISQSVKSLRQTLETMNRSLEHLASITQKIDQGEGTIGALVNDPSIHDGIEEAVESVNDLVGGVSRLQTWVNLRSEFQFRAGATKNYVQFIIQPREDKYYLFEVVDDPRGVRETVIEDVETTSPEQGRNFVYRERRTTTITGLKFSAQFAKRFGWLNLRFGIIENSGGVGANLLFLDDRLEFLLDANQFDEEARNPRVKALALLEIIPHVYLHGGIDDFFNPGTTDYFLGAGVKFNDEDLRVLLLTVGAPVGK